MELQERHPMLLDEVHPSGAEEWFCPTCGRRFLMTWPPNYKKIVLVPGDENAIHTGGKAPEGVSFDVGTVSVEQAPTDEEQDRLAPWEAWAEKNLGDDEWA